MSPAPGIPLAVAGTLLNASGVLLACEAWGTSFRRRIPALLAALGFAAWLESALRSAGLRVMVVDAAAWTALGGVLVFARRRFGRRNTGPKRRPAAETDLRETVEAFLSAVDQGDAEAVASFYDPSFACVRVADSGGFASLSRAQMLSIFKGEGRAPGLRRLTVSETKVWHVDEDGYVILTRTKDLGRGPEPLFYTLVWRRGETWRLTREFVHQRSAPSWA